MNNFELEKSHQDTAIKFAEWLSLNWYRFSLKREVWVNEFDEDVDIEELYLKFLTRYRK